MSKIVQWKRGNTSQTSSYVGYDGEITVNTDDYSLHIHDGSTPGGHKVSGDGNIAIGNLSVVGQTISGTISNTNIDITPLGTGNVVVPRMSMGNLFVSNQGIFGSFPNGAISLVSTGQFGAIVANANNMVVGTDLSFLVTRSFGNSALITTAGRGNGNIGIQIQAAPGTRAIDISPQNNHIGFKTSPNPDIPFTFNGAISATEMYVSANLPTGYQFTTVGGDTGLSHAYYGNISVLRLRHTSENVAQFYDNLTTQLTGNLVVSQTGQEFGTFPNAFVQVYSNVASYSQFVLQNLSADPGASSDIVLTGDDGTDSTQYLDIGMASSTYNYPGFGVIKPDDAYIFVVGADAAGPGSTENANLILGSTNGNVKVFVGAPEDANVVASFASDGLYGAVQSNYAPKEIHVSPNGNDSWSGAMGAPLATIQAAVDKTNNTGYKVVIHPGVYTEDVTVGSGHNNVSLVASESDIGQSVDIIGNLNITGNAAGTLIQGISVDNFNVSATGGGYVYPRQMHILNSATISGNVTMRALDCEFEVTGSFNVTGPSFLYMQATRIINPVLANASATLQLKGCPVVFRPNVSAGRFVSEESTITCNVGQSGLTATGGTIIFRNTSIINTASNVAPVTMSGVTYSFNNVVFDQENSNITGSTEVATDSHFNTVHADTMLSDGNITANGNVSATYFIGNGAFLTDIGASSNYGNANVAAYLPTYTGDIAANIVKNNNTWTFGADGTTIPPTLTTTRGDTSGGSITGYTLRIGNGTQEAIITTPDGSEGTGPNSQRLVINPGKGQDGTYGEGGDIYLWAGRGGTGGGTGGDIKIRGGQGMSNGDGGYIRIEPGDSQGTGQGGYLAMYAGQTAGGSGGYVDIRGGYNSGGNGGYVQIIGGQGAVNGADTSIKGGNGDSGVGGDLNLFGGQSGQGLPGYGNVNIYSGASSWAFNRSGTMLVPNAGTITTPNATAGLGGQAITIAAGASDQTTWNSNPGGALNLRGGYGSFNDGYGEIGGAVNIYGGLSPENNSGNVNIFTGSTSEYNWKFDNTGSLTVPGSIRNSDSTAIISFSTNVARIDAGSGTSYIEVQDQNLFIISNTVAISSGGSSWEFTPNGNITLPSNISAINYANGTSILTGIGGGGTPTAIVNANGTVYIDSTGNINFGINGSNFGHIQYGGGVAIGATAGNLNQGLSAVAIGSGAATENQGYHSVAIGWNVGQYNQGTSSIAIGENPAFAVQGNSAIAIGTVAARSGQGDYAIAMGTAAGFSGQTANAVAIGTRAGQYTQGTSAVAIGELAGNSSQSSYAIAIGQNAGATSQGLATVGIGMSAGGFNQGYVAIGIGSGAGSSNQGQRSVAIGVSAGTSAQGNSAVAIGDNAGAQSQGNTSIALGTYAGAYTQGSNAAAIGYHAGFNSQGSYSIAMGDFAANSGQATAAVAIGLTAGYQNQGQYSVAIGQDAARVTQGQDAVAIGSAAGRILQGTAAVAVGSSAAISGQGQYGVAVGPGAGGMNQGTQGIAIGLFAAQDSQGAGAIAIGSYAGNVSQGAGAVAIGNYAGESSQVSNSIALNASGVAINPANSGFYVAPVRNDTGNVTNAVYYNTTTKELTYGAAGGSGNYGNTNVATFLGSYGSNTIVTTGNVNTGNVTFTNNNNSLTFNTGAYITGNVVGREGSIKLEPAATGTFQGVMIGGAGRIIAPNGSVHQILNSADVTFQVATKITVGTSSTSTSTGALQVTGGAGITGNLYVGGNSSTGVNSIVAGITNSIVFSNAVANFSSNANSYAQINTQNKNGNSAATTDYVATANNGTDLINYINMGIAGNTYDNASPNNSLGTLLYANDSYLYAQGNTAADVGGNLVVGATTAGKVVKIFANGINSSSTVATFSNTGIAMTGNLTATGNVTVSANVVAGNIVTTGSGGNISGVNVLYANSAVLSSNAAISMPARPAMRVYGSGSTTIGVNTTLTSTHFTVDYNQNSNLDTTSGVFTAPFAGLYQVTLNARVGTNNGTNQVGVFKNNNTSGGANVICFWETDTNTGTATHFGVSGVANLSVGDTLRARVVLGNIQFDSNDSWTVTYIG